MDSSRDTAGWSIVSGRFEEMLSIEPSRLSPAQAADYLAADIKQLNDFKDPQLRRAFAVTIGSIAKDFPSYRAELNRRPEALRAEIAEALETDLRMPAKKDDSAIPFEGEGAASEVQRLRSRSLAHPSNSTAYVEIEQRAEAMARNTGATAHDGARWAREDIAAFEHVQEEERSIALAAISRSQVANRGYAAALSEYAPDLVDAVARNKAQFVRIDSVPDAFMRPDPLGRGVEVNDRGQYLVLHNLAEIEGWAADHDASQIDKERLVSLSMQEKTGHSAPPTQSTLKEENMQGQQQQAEIKRIGANMPKADWQMAIDLLKARAPEERGKVYIPKAGAEYGGQVLLLTETHIVQRVGRGTAIAHDLDKLENGRALHGDIDAGKIKPGMHMNVQYGDERGNAKIIPFSQQRAAEIHRDLTSWAEKNITNAKGRETFLKHLANATKDLGQAQAPQRPASAPQPSMSRGAPQRDR